jgi:DNA helicase-2/ATP-dependent DNA helicase PcrA
LEYRIQDIHIDGVPVKGFIDRVDRDGDRIVVIDYKSGRPEYLSSKLKAPSAQDPLGGNYWRQMVFYDLLLRADPKTHKGMTAGFIQAMEPTKIGGLVEKQVDVTEEDRQQVTTQIVDTYKKIQAMEFEHGCGECDWCRMHDISPRVIRDEDDFFKIMSKAVEVFIYLLPHRG